MDWMTSLFSYVCGQVNLWSLGGDVLPFCQRCTGLYVGGAYAFVVWTIFRPRPTTAILGVHVIALVLMVPFGYHLVPQGAEVRMLTGQIFAAGLAYLLLLNPAQRVGLWQHATNHHAGMYLATLLAGLPVLQLAVHFGGLGTARILAYVGLAGLVGFALVSVANLLLLPAAAVELLRKPGPSHSAAGGSRVL